MRFQNLAGAHPEVADNAILAELFVAEIPSWTSQEDDGVTLDMEVPTKYYGKYRGFVFIRAWKYWRVNGFMPLDKAREIYEQRPYGRSDVRVAGHCGCPAPEDPWVYRVAEDGKEVIIPSKTDQEFFDKVDSGTLTGFYSSSEFIESIKRLRAEKHFVGSIEERDALTVQAGIKTYHIDSQAGLKVFMDTLRA